MQKALFPLVAFLLGTLLYIPPLRDLPFSSRGEAREALVVQAMIEQENPILPWRNGESIPSKPPLFHWTALLSVGLVGDLTGATTTTGSESAIRLPSALAAALSIAVLVAFTGPRLGVGAAAFAAAVLATSVEWARSANIARVDMLFALWISCGMFALFRLIDRYARSGEFSHRQLAALALILALATLTKGPAGLAIPWAIASLYFVAILPIRKLPLLPALGSIAITVALAGVWYLAAYLQGGSEFLDVHLMRENYARIIGRDDYETGHDGPAYAIVGLLVSGLLPWSIFLPAVVWAVWRRRNILRTEEDCAVLFMLIWIAFFMVFFGATASKRSVYLLPCYPAFAYLAAWTLFTPGARSDATRALKLSAWLAAAAAAVLVAIVLTVSAVGACCGATLPIEMLTGMGVKLKPHVVNQIEQVLSTLQGGPLALGGILLSASAAAVAAFRLRQGRAVEGAFSLAAGAALLLIVISNAIFPPIARGMSPKSFMQLVTARVGDRPLYQFNDDAFHAATFYAGRPVPTILAIPILKDDGPSYIVAPKGSLPAILSLAPNARVTDESPMLDVYGKDRFILVQLTPTQGDL